MMIATLIFEQMRFSVKRKACYEVFFVILRPVRYDI